MSELETGLGEAISSQDAPQEQSVFDQPFQIMDEDDGFITPSDSLFETQYSETQTPTNDQNQPAQPPVNTPPADNTQTPPAENQPAAPAIDFGDELVKKFNQTQDPNQFNQEEAIRKLQEQGFKISQEETETPDVKDQQEFNRLNSDISSIDQLLKQGNDYLVQNKIHNDLADTYKNTGRAHLINGEEFKLELEQKVEEISMNETTKNIYAENIRNNINSYKSGLQSELDKINQRTQHRKEQSMAEERSRLQTSLTSFAGNSFLGQQITAEQVQQAYKDITSGEFTKKVNSDPNLVAEFALFLQNRDAIKGTVTGKTYGEGVKAAVDAINSNNGLSKSALQQAIQQGTSAQGSQVTSRAQLWRDAEVKPETNNQQPTPEDINSMSRVSRFVAGRG